MCFATIDILLANDRQRTRLATRIIEVVISLNLTIISADCSILLSPERLDLDMLRLCRPRHSKLSSVFTDVRPEICPSHTKKLHVRFKIVLHLSHIILTQSKYIARISFVVNRFVFATGPYYSISSLFMPFICSFFTVCLPPIPSPYKQFFCTCCHCGIHTYNYYRTNLS